MLFGCRERGAGQDQVQPEETQAEQEAEDAFHHATIARAREEVHGKAIPERRGEGRILVLPSPHRDSGERFDVLLPSSSSSSSVYINFEYVFVVRIFREFILLLGSGMDRRIVKQKSLFNLFYSFNIESGRLFNAMFEKFSGKSVGCNLNKENKFSKLLCGGEFFYLSHPVYLIKVRLYIL